MQFFDSVFNFIVSPELQTFHLYLSTLLHYTASNYPLFFTIKLSLLMMFLILIRGGVPRYRYDFLTKLGWVKFLGYVLSIFLVVFFTITSW